MKLENILLIDIETVPERSSYDQLDVAKQRLWEKKSTLFKEQDESSASMFEERAGIYAEFGKIVCIGLGYFTKENGIWKLKLKAFSGHDEREILSQFVKVCDVFFKGNERKFCGHNIREFDIPYICRRCLIQQVSMPRILADLQDKKPWENPMFDTLQLWKFGEYKHFISVDLLANVLNIESPKGDIDGSDVARVYWQDGDINRIATYCKKDVETVAQIILKLKGLPIIEPENIIYID
ncbi:MAG: ribonuclease H-like domain-containing protein [Chitinophagaceae bacterium]|nr:MAG: DNA polymerase elongation subunit [Bacteroidetes bacterium OLB11]MCC6447608.1 ribonuclease H-like domain-containing protein [Chitinophagaceae bacterium]HMN32422.1 ribonuclease H-like domain-containing protein [Chitinophagaceae bacterium]